jgi:serine/threonine-protein kinase
VLFTVGSSNSPNNYDGASLAVYSRETGRRSTVLKGGTMGRYLTSGHLVFLRSGVLFAVPFDKELLRVTGEPVPVIEAIGAEPSSGAGYFSISDTGVLAYAPATSGLTERLVLADATGTVTSLNLPLDRYRTPRFSPDGRRIAYSVGAGGGADDNIWIYDLETGVPRRLTFGGSDMVPVWSPDGERVYYNSVPGGGRRQGIYWKASDGSGAEQMVFPSEAVVTMPTQMVDGGRRIFLTRYSPTIRNIEADLSNPDLPARMLGTGEGYQWGARTSPNGRWLAYASTETGREEIYVEPVEGAGRWQVSTDGGVAPVWGAEGRTLYYADHLGLNRVDVQTGDRFEHGPSSRLFEGRFRLQMSPLTNYDLSPGGDAFVLVQPSESEESAPQVVVTLNWFSELERLLAEGR